MLRLYEAKYKTKVSSEDQTLLEFEDSAPLLNEETLLIMNGEGVYAPSFEVNSVSWHGRNFSRNAPRI